MTAKGFSGKGGTVHTGTADGASASTKICEVVKWTLEQSVAVNKYHSNCTDAHKRAVAGVRDTKGTIEIKVDKDAGPGLVVGDEVALRLGTDSDGGSGAAINYFHIKHAVISSTPIECDVEDGNIVGMTYNFEASDCTGYGIYA